MFMRLFASSLIAFSLACSNGYAQSGVIADKDKQRVKTEISLVAIGPKPERKYKESKQGEAPVMLLPQAGETPPARLYYKGEFDRVKTTWLAWNLSFNNPSSMREIIPEKELHLYRKCLGEERYIPYLTIPAGKVGSRRIFFLQPAGGGPRPWEQKPLLQMIALGAGCMQGKQLMIKNLSDFTVLHAFEGNVVSLAPKESISYNRAKAGQLYRLAARYGLQKKIIYNTAFKLNDEGCLQIYVLYNANPKTNAGRSVGVFRMLVPAP